MNISLPDPIKIHLKIHFSITKRLNQIQAGICQAQRIPLWDIFIQWEGMSVDFPLFGQVYWTILESKLNKREKFEYECSLSSQNQK